MDWKEWLEKIRLIDITPKFEGKQVGAINVNVENKTENKIYNFNFYGAQETGAIVAGSIKIDGEFEKRVKEEAERRLTNLGISPELLSDGARTEIGTLTTAATAVRAIGGKLSFEGRVTAVILPKSTEPEK